MIGDSKKERKRERKKQQSWVMLGQGRRWWCGEGFHTHAVCLSGSLMITGWVGGSQGEISESLKNLSKKEEKNEMAPNKSGTDTQ